MVNQSSLASGRDDTGGLDPEDHAPPDQSHPITAWIDRWNTVLTCAAGLVAPVVYFSYVDHYGVNSFFFDDYSTFGAMNAAIHNQPIGGWIWQQYTEGRQVLSNAAFAFFALLDHANVRTILLFSAIILAVSYAILLVLYRHYTGNRLTPLPVLIIGLVWFSLADVGSSLFAYQLSTYFVLLSIAVMLFALLVPHNHRTIWFAIGVLAATCSSLGFLDGFIAWPLGLVCILWAGPRTRRTTYKVTAWIASMLCIGVIYFRGYQASGCAPVAHCSIGNSLSHPVIMMRVYLVLLGGVLPGGYFGPKVHDTIRFEVVGAALLAGALFIIIQSWRYRSARERMPLPMLLILFGLLWDAMIAGGRTGVGVDFLIGINRYVMPNIVVLTGIVMYALAQTPRLRHSSTRITRVTVVTWLTLSALALFLVVQIAQSTDFGLVNGAAAHRMFTLEARLWVNLDRVPIADRSCEVARILDTGLFVGGPPPQPAYDHLGEFGPSTYLYYRAMGPPPLAPSCVKRQ